MISLFKSWFYLKPVLLWLMRAQIKSWKKDPIFWLMIYVPIAMVLILYLFPSLAEIVLPPSAHAAEQAPVMPDIRNFDSQGLRLRNNSRMDAAEQAALSGRMPRIPNIQNPQKGVDIAQIANQYHHKALSPNSDDLLIFVSLSMPQDALLKLARQARDTRAVMVMRGIQGGLQKGSWIKAMNAIKPITDTGASLIIHPDFYKKYHVTQVPTFILTSNQSVESCDKTSACAQKLLATGDVSLDYVLEHWADGKGALAELAREKLSLLEQSRK